MDLITDQSFDAAYDGLDRRLVMLRMDLADVRRRISTARKIEGWAPDFDPLVEEIRAELRKTLGALS